MQANVDAWLASALAAHLGLYRDQAARAAATGLLTAPVLAHAVLLAGLASLPPEAEVDQMTFVARLATAEPNAKGTHAEFLARVQS
ncbi:hypothetical protein ACIQJT_35010 [Streptomyces sp. NPDC091972]|uniref:hypothetical protein n=1 Tax=Streptomyces sp. NPDC091972 TaxID=3366007 RepID=UPI00382E943C